MRTSLTVFLIAALLLWIPPAAAQLASSCTPGGSNSAGHSADLTGNNWYCNGNTNTVTYPAYWFGSTSTACAAATAGLAQWTGSELEYCNNSSAWQSFLSGITTGTQYDLVYYPASAAGVTGDTSITTDAKNVLKIVSSTVTASDP
jgi:hypothetical protein